MRKLLLIMILALLGTNVAHAQPGIDPARDAAEWGDDAPAARAFLEQSRAKGVSQEFVNEVLGQARDMQAKNLPVGPYFSKASEGLVKGVPPQKIRPALAATRGRIQTADGLVDRAIQKGAAPGSPEVRRAATLRMQNAMLNQISPKALERMEDSLSANRRGRFDVDEIGRGASELSRKQYNNLSKGKGNKGYWREMSEKNKRDAEGGKRKEEHERKPETPERKIEKIHGSSPERATSRHSGEKGEVRRDKSSHGEMKKKGKDSDGRKKSRGSDKEKHGGGGHKGGHGKNK